MAVLLALGPLALVDSPVRPIEVSFSVLHVVVVTALILGAVRPLHLPMAGHMAILPLPVVDPTVRELVAALAVHLVVPELALELHARARLVDTDAVLAAVEELSGVPGAVRPGLHAAARLLVLLPLPLIRAAVHVDVLAKPVGPIAIPLALVRVAIGGREDPVAVCLRVTEGALVALPIGPHEDAVAVPLLRQPLALVLRAALYLLLWALLQVLFALNARPRHGLLRVQLLLRPGGVIVVGLGLRGIVLSAAHGPERP
mmetsp:Transcript_147954/g.368719  ORF Transcript_147954/g.368719 Transcript_147954/m.368719 type:complete len:258 (+) Transcript_147954:124-897(+)